MEQPLAAVLMLLAPGARTGTAKALELRLYGSEAQSMQRAHAGTRCENYRVHDHDCMPSSNDY